MKQPKKLFIIFLVSTVVVLLVNIAANYRYYAAGNDWKFSVIFTLLYNLFAWGFFMGMYKYVYSRIKWSDNPTYRILSGALLFAVSGFAFMFITQMVILRYAFGHVSMANIISNCLYSAVISMVIGLIITSQQTLIHLKTSIEENEQIKQEMIQSQYEALKSQVNPHFFFNSLNTLMVMIPTQPDIAVQFVEQLSKVFRYSLQYSGENTIDVATELTVVRSYLFLNEQRFGSKLKVEITLDEQALHKKIITQALLMLVENAIKHNELSERNPLSLVITNNGDVLVVRNTLQRKTLAEPSTNLGLANIRKRYAMASGVPVNVEECGGWFTVSLPLL